MTMEQLDTISDDTREKILSVAREVMVIDDVTWEAAKGSRVRLRGQLTVPPDDAYAVVGPRLEPLGYTPLLRNEADKDVLLIMEGTFASTQSKGWLAAVLLVLTVISTLYAGAVADGNAELLESEGIVRWLLSGWPFALSLMAILGAHELSHYFAMRHFRVPASLPYFIPFPNLFGTMGAFIRMKSQPKNRRELFAIGVAGPLAGLIVAIPVLLLGLYLSEVEPLPTVGPYLLEGNSLLYAALKYVVFGRLLPSDGVDVSIHPVALAGWAGLFVTALNLIPAGQLDGGHIIFALFGDRAKPLTWFIIAALVGLGFLWEGWFLWAGLIFVFGRLVARPFDDLTRLNSSERRLGIVMLIVFVLIFTPIPMQFIP